MDDSSDDELNEARQRLKKKNAELYEIAKRLQIEAAEGKLGAEQLANPSKIHTPVDSEEEGGVGRKPRVRSIVVSQNTDWNTFVWSIGQRFTTKEAFREAVIHYAVAQGKNMSFVGSSKKQLQKLEAKCLPACPFQKYDEKQIAQGYMVSKTVLEIFKSRPHWPAKEIKV
ncbi:50S ribosomal protein L3 [Bienertia sinuspersici]